MDGITRLTVRLPTLLYERLRRRARDLDLSLNQTIIETLQHGLECEPPEESVRTQSGVLEDRNLDDTLTPKWREFVVNDTSLPLQEDARPIVEPAAHLPEIIIEEEHPDDTLSH